MKKMNIILAGLGIVVLSAFLVFITIAKTNVDKTNDTTEKTDEIEVQNTNNTKVNSTQSVITCALAVEKDEIRSSETIEFYLKDETLLNVIEKKSISYQNDSARSTYESRKNDLLKEKLNYSIFTGITISDNDSDKSYELTKNYDTKKIVTSEFADSSINPNNVKLNYSKNMNTSDYISNLKKNGYVCN
jgi:hypothetical protein